MMIFFLLIVILSTGNYTNSQEYQAVQLPTTIVREIKSDIVKNMVYELYIDLPPRYKTSDRSYPVVYLLDAYEIFGLQLQTYQQLIFMKEIPEIILVGIAYRIDGNFYTDGLRRHMDIRARDFTPTHMSYEQTVERHGEEIADYVRVSGGGKEFLGFIEKELIPFIEKEYRADSQKRGIFGYSLGATFVTYALFARPGLFRNYFIGSPFLNWDDKAVYKFDHTDKLLGSGDTVNVYLSWGELESSTGRHHPLKDYLEEKANPNIILLSEVLQGETHLSGIGLAHSRAFRRLYGM
ncbi:MAG: alpha/beta hydrolase [Calditrichaeota bacterium]|nr:alpha/beta hydrolase [Calditrichota bacterium]